MSQQQALWPARAGLPALLPGEAVHLVGIGGAGMSGLARGLQQLGLRVSGSDRDDSATLAALRQEGIMAKAGHAAERVPADCRLLLHTPAVGSENPELAEASRRGIAVAKRAPLLGALMESRLGLAVAGTHGKTTTSGMVAYLLERLGWDPSYFVGGDLPDLGSNARIGAGEALVVEADEYDRTFLHYAPAMAVITSLEPDHPDIYPDAGNYLAAFQQFASQVGRHLLVNAAWPLVAELEAAEGAVLERYAVEGDPGTLEGAEPEWQALALQQDGDLQTFELVHGGASLGRWETQLQGRHNVGNALAAVALCLVAGADPEALRQHLPGYRGAKRRFQHLGRAARIDVVDDYAHHPTEIEASLDAAAGRYPGRRRVAVVEPHTYSRVIQWESGFRRAIAGAERAIVAPIYAAREAAVPGLDAARIAEGIETASPAHTIEEAADLACSEALEEDVLLFMGAGRSSWAAKRAWKGIRRRALDALVQLADARSLGGERLADAALARHTTLRVGGTADMVVRLRQLEDLAGWWLAAKAVDLPVRVLGRGSNVLVGDAGLPGLVLLNRCEGWSLEQPEDAEKDATATSVMADAGLTLAALAQVLARQGYCGFEQGVGIPGSVGAGVITNAGAHGWEMRDSLIELEVLRPDGQRVWLSPDDLDFRYRGSNLKGQLDRLVLRARLRLETDEPAEILERIEGYSRHRRDTQPREPSVGSVFMNPDGDYAGRLIEEAGLKGRCLGGAQVSKLHANFVINTGGATAADLRGLIGDMRRAVERSQGTRLQTEIELIGDGDAG